MELSSPLRWLAAIGVMLVVVVIAGSLLLNTLSNTVELASGASEEPVDEFSESASDDPSAAPDDDGGGDGDGDDGDDNGDGDDEFPQEYTVVAGDTGAEISEQFYGDEDGWSAIAEANDIDPGAPLRVGEELEIPEPE
jgi:nucleoid-associated protein YgaU